VLTHLGDTSDSENGVFAISEGNRMSGIEPFS
jgi:hypothetical protein